MQDTLNIALVQSSIDWENAAQNRDRFEMKIKALGEQVDLVLLPEMFTTGFTMNPGLIAESMDGESVDWMKKISAEHGLAIAGSLVIKDGGEFFNRLVFAEPKGTVSFYDKRHTFTLAGEDKVYSRGTAHLLIDYKGWRICPLVCYDLRFPVWSRNVFDYDLLLYLANWPEPRIAAWDALLKARAIENMSYCIGVNRIGSDPENNTYIGHSAVYDGLGETVSFLGNSDKTEVVSLKKDHLNTIRRTLKFLDDKDAFNLEV